VLDSTDSVTELLRNAPNLRQSTENGVRDSIFINADMTAAERQLAYEERVIRRKPQILSALALPFASEISTAAIADVPSTV